LTNLIKQGNLIVRHSKYLEKLKNNGLIFSGKAPGREIMQILELKDHPFFIGTQMHPEYLSRPLKPHPLYMGFIKAILLHC